jgi:branched-chain amino acid transport system permease protein
MTATDAGAGAGPGTDAATSAAGGLTASRGPTSGTSSTLPALATGTAAAVVLLLWVGGSGYRQDLATLAATYSLIALGMYVPFVMAGSLSMAYAAYAGIGAYAVGVVSRDTSLPIWFGWLVGPVIAALLALVLGFATRRLSGFYLTSVTLLFSTAFAAWLLDAGGITGGASGMHGIRDLDILGWEPTRAQQVVLASALVVALAWGIDRLRQSPWGVTVRTMREVPLAVETAGVRTPTLVLVSLAFGAMVASLAGALFASFVGGVTPETFTVHIVFLAIFMPLIGGAGTPWGAVLGALLVVEFTLNFPALDESGTLLLCLATIVILLVAPRGVLGYLDALRTRLLSAGNTGKERNSE